MDVSAGPARVRGLIDDKLEIGAESVGQLHLISSDHRTHLSHGTGRKLQSAARSCRVTGCEQQRAAARAACVDVVEIGKVNNNANFFRGKRGFARKHNQNHCHNQNKRQRFF